MGETDTMCGRYILTSTGDVIAAAFDLEEPPEVAARYNIAPGQDALVICATSADGQCRSQRWGFRDEGSGRRSLINARSETVAN